MAAAGAWFLLCLGVAAPAGAQASSTRPSPIGPGGLAEPLTPAAEASQRLARPYGPDVPMNNPGLEGSQRPERRLTGPTPYFRGEDHGGVLGVSLPFLHKRRSTAP
jgi:hypothetical protein